MGFPGLLGDFNDHIMITVDEAQAIKKARALRGNKRGCCFYEKAGNNFTRVLVHNMEKDAPALHVGASAQIKG